MGPDPDYRVVGGNPGEDRHTGKCGTGSPEAGNAADLDSFSPLGPFKCVTDLPRGMLWIRRNP